MRRRAFIDSGIGIDLRTRRRAITGLYQCRSLGHEAMRRCYAAQDCCLTARETLGDRDVRHRVDH